MCSEIGLALSLDCAEILLVLGDSEYEASQIADLQEVDNKNVFIGNDWRIIQQSATSRNRSHSSPCMSCMLNRASPYPTNVLKVVPMFDAFRRKGPASGLRKTEEVLTLV